MSELKAWPLGGYAPGGYHCTCLDCGTVFEGDKRAHVCLECAVIRAKSRPTPSRNEVLEEAAKVADRFAMIADEAYGENSASAAGKRDVAAAIRALKSRGDHG